jgi:hypothetical protein
MDAVVGGGRVVSGGRGGVNKARFDHRPPTFKYTFKYPSKYYHLRLVN